MNLPLNWKPVSLLIVISNTPANEQKKKKHTHEQQKYERNALDEI